MSAFVMPMMFSDIKQPEQNHSFDYPNKEISELPMLLAALKGQLLPDVAFTNEFQIRVATSNAANRFQNCEYLYQFLDASQIVMKFSRNSSLPTRADAFSKQLQRISVISPDRIGESEEEEESDEIQRLRQRKLVLIRSRRALKRKFWLPFSVKLQAELHNAEKEIELLNAEIFEKTRTQVDVKGMLADLKQGQEKLSLCLQRLENSHAQENLR
jgi:hypothetical protein